MRLYKMDSKKITKIALVLAIALIVSLVENILPPLVPVLPFAKLGLTNVVLLFAILIIGVPEGFLILILKCLFMAIFSANFSALIWSFPAGIVAYIVMTLMKYSKIFSITGISAAGGIIHNVMQILIAIAILGNSVVFYLPYMILAGGVAGLVTGIICQLLYISIEKYQKIRKKTT